MTDFPLETEAKMVKLFNIYSDLSKKKYEYCHGVFLLPTEVHAAVYIFHCNTPCNITDIANELGITKGAVSKMAVKLEGMSIIRRYKYVTNQKEVFLELTDLGTKVCLSHSAYHQPMYNALKEYFERLTEVESQALIDFLSLYFEQMKNLGVKKSFHPQ